MTIKKTYAFLSIVNAVSENSNFFLVIFLKRWLNPANLENTVRPLHKLFSIPMKLVSVFMDVEDPINSLADDAALDFARLFSNADVKGSFCITGEKCRVLSERGRSDVIEALSTHCLGLHTNTHSYHPTTMELLSELQWEEGCQAAYDSEVHGAKAFKAAFGRTPQFWGGAGNTWSPEITDALKRLNIPAYSYALTRLPNQAVHRFNGIVAMPQAMSISEDSWMDEGKASSEIERVLRGIHEIEHPWIGIFVGHPTRFRYQEFWDRPFWHGEYDQAAHAPALVDEQIYEAAKRHLSGFLQQLSRRVQIVGVDDMLGMPWQFTKADISQLTYFEQHTREAIQGAARWVVHKPGLDASNIVSKTLALADTLEVASLP